MRNIHSVAVALQQNISVVNDQFVTCIPHHSCILSLYVPGSHSIEIILCKLMF